MAVRAAVAIAPVSRVRSLLPRVCGRGAVGRRGADARVSARARDRCRRPAVDSGYRHVILDLCESGYGVRPRGDRSRSSTHSRNQFPVESRDGDGLPVRLRVHALGQVPVTVGGSRLEGRQHSSTSVETTSGSMPAAARCLRDLKATRAATA